MESQYPLIVLVRGQPGQGKSYLSLKLRDEHSFAYLDTDREYVQFIKSECPFLYFDNLSKHIGKFYLGIFCATSYSEETFGRDLVSEWHSYLLGRIKELITHYSKIVVDGYLLFDCGDTFEAELSSDAEVRLVEVESRTYLLNGLKVTPEDIGAQKRSLHSLTHSPQLRHEQLKNRDRQLEASEYLLQHRTKQLQQLRRRLKKRTEQLEANKEQLQTIQNSNTWKLFVKILSLRKKILERFSQRLHG